LVPSMLPLADFGQLDITDGTAENEVYDIEQSGDFNLVCLAEDGLDESALAEQLREPITYQMGNVKAMLYVERIRWAVPRQATDWLRLV
jgi:hypothetical protein